MLSGDDVHPSSEKIWSGGIDYWRLYFTVVSTVIQSGAYVWKIEKYGNEETSGITDERGARGPEKNDYGNAGERPSVV